MLEFFFKTLVNSILKDGVSNTKHTNSYQILYLKHYYLILIPYSSKYQFIFSHQTLNNSFQTNFNTNQWYHVAGTYDGSQLNLYVNGILDGQYNYSEITYGKFSRNFNLPDDIVDEKVSAKMKSGILAVCIPRMEHIKKESKKISIK